MYASHSDNIDFPLTLSNTHYEYTVINEDINKGTDTGEDYVSEQQYSNFTANRSLDIFEDDFSEAIDNFKSGAHIFLKDIDDAYRFGVAELDDNNNIISIEEKPIIPKSNFAVTGFYIKEIPEDKKEEIISDCIDLFTKFIYM